jgi:hypothetical protein
MQGCAIGSRKFQINYFAEGARVILTDAICVPTQAWRYARELLHEQGFVGAAFVAAALALAIASRPKHVS